MRRLFEQLPRLALANLPALESTQAAKVNLQACASDAETTVSTIHQGLGAIGHLLAHSAPEIEDGTIGADSVESLGFLMAELGDLAAACMTLAAHCRRASHQVEPQQAADDTGPQDNP